MAYVPQVYNPYQYGYGGIGYVPYQTTGGVAPSAPPAPSTGLSGQMVGDPAPTTSAPGGSNTGTSAGTFGSLAGTMAGMAAGVTGLGPIGGAIGTAVDVGSMNETLGGMNEAPGVSFGPALAHNLSFGIFGRSPTEQALDTIESNPATQAQAAKEAQVSLDAFGNMGATGPTSSVSGGNSTSQAAPSSPAGGAAAASGGHGDGGGGSGGDGGCVVTTQLVASGMMDLRAKREYLVFCKSQKHGKWAGEAQRRGYQTWGALAVKAMRKYPFAGKLMKSVAGAYQKHISWKMGKGPFSLSGWALAATLEPVSFVIGLFNRKPNWKRLYEN